jgi:hypothetical protein
MKTTSMSCSTQSKWTLAFCMVFATAVYQLPLYSSNQHTYFLAGMANAGHGYLRTDWLANTTDSMPFFSLLVEGIKRISMEWLFNATFMLLAATYFLALLIISIDATKKEKLDIKNLILLASAITLVHAADQFQPIAKAFPSSAPLIEAFVKWCGALRSGVAGQYILGNILQPATFGALILLSIALFMRKKNFLAILACTTAASFHPTYALHAAVLVFIYLVHDIREKKLGKTALLATIASVCISPIALYVIIKLRPTSIELTSIAQNILINERIPHHAMPSNWLNSTAAFQYALIATGTMLAHSNRRLFSVMAGGTLGMTILTLVQIGTNNTTLSLMFPWRMSVWLVPLSTALVISSAIERLNANGKPGRKVTFLNFGVIFFGALSIALALNGARRTSQQPAITERQALYETAKKLPPGQWMTPVDFEDFRISTGLPLFVDWKSHPYRDAEVIEWKSRIDIAQAFYNGKDSQTQYSALKSAIIRGHITYVAVPANPTFTRLINPPEIELIHPESSAYAILVLRDSTKE